MFLTAFSAILSVGSGILARVPGWVMVLAAVAAWGAFQRHEAAAARDKLAAQQQAQERARADAIRDALVDRVRAEKAQEEAAHEAQEKARRARRDADAAVAALQRLRDSAAARAGAVAGAASAAGDGAPAPDAAGVLADMLGRCGERVRRLAAIGDERGAAGEECERRYDALTPQGR